LFFPSLLIGVGSTSACCTFCLLGHTCSRIICGLNPLYIFPIPIYCLYLWFPNSFLSRNLSSFLWLSLKWWSKLVACSYHCSILVGGFSTSISFLLIVLFVPLLNSSTSALPLYLLLLAALQNSCTNSSIVFPSYSILLSSATLTDSLSSPNSLIPIKILLLPNLPINSHFIYLVIFPAHMIIPIKSVLLLMLFSFSFSNTTYMSW